MDGSGKLIIQDSLDKINEEIINWYGFMNEVKMGARSKLPEKPEALQLYEGWKLSGLPLVAGGYIDQPYLTSIFIEQAASSSQMMEYLNAAQAAQNQPGG